MQTASQKDTFIHDIQDSVEVFVINRRLITKEKPMKLEETKTIELASVHKLNIVDDIALKIKAGEKYVEHLQFTLWPPFGQGTYHKGVEKELLQVGVEKGCSLIEVSQATISCLMVDWGALSRRILTLKLEMQDATEQRKQICDVPVAFKMQAQEKTSYIDKEVVQLKLKDIEEEWRQLHDFSKEFYADEGLPQELFIIPKQAEKHVQKELKACKLKYGTQIGLLHEDIKDELS